MRRPRARSWYANGKTVSWKSVTAAGSYVMRKSRRLRPSNRRRPNRGSRDGCRRRPRPAIHGGNAINKCRHEGGRRNEKESCGNGGVEESVEIQKQDFPSSHHLLGNLAKPARFPQSHSSGDETVEKWKTKSRFPTFPPPSLGLNEEQNQNQPTA